MSIIRTKDSYQKRVYDFITDIYVICPACGKQAIVLTPGYTTQKKNEQEIKLICAKCGHNKHLDEKPNAVFLKTSNQTITGKYTIIGGAINPYFHLPLWFTVKWGDHILWAYNYDHLDFLYGHVQAKLRGRNLEEMKNKSLGSRLPKWMTSARNREMILKALTALKNKK